MNAKVKGLWEKVKGFFVKINKKTQVLDKENKPIKGLYAAGTVTGGIHGKNRLGGNGLADAIVFGRTAGQQVVLNDNSKE